MVSALPNIIFVILALSKPENACSVNKSYVYPSWLQICGLQYLIVTFLRNGGFNIQWVDDSNNFVEYEIRNNQQNIIMETPILTTSVSQAYDACTDMYSLPKDLLCVALRRLQLVLKNKKIIKFL